MPPLTGVRPSLVRNNTSTGGTTRTSTTRDTSSTRSTTRTGGTTRPSTARDAYDTGSRTRTEETARPRRGGGVRVTSTAAEMKSILKNNEDVRLGVLHAAFGASMKRGTSAEITSVKSNGEGGFEVGVKLTNVRTKAVMDEARVTLSAAGAVEEIRGKPSKDDPNTRINDEIWRNGPIGGRGRHPGGRAPSEDTNAIRPNRSGEMDWSAVDDNIRRHGPI
jgi:hypothetical protein